MVLSLALVLTASAATAQGTYKYCQTVYVYEQPGGIHPPRGPIAGVRVRLSIYANAVGCGGGGQPVCRSGWAETDANGRARVCCTSDVNIGNLARPAAWCVESDNECRSPWWQAGSAGACYIRPGALPWAGNARFGVGGSGSGLPTPTVAPTPTPRRTPTPPAGGTVEPPPGPETPEPPQPTAPVPPPTPPPYNPPRGQAVVIHFGLDVENPVVVGQDPDRRGADIFLELRVPAVVYDYEVEYAPGRWARGRQVATDFADLRSGRYRFQATLTARSRDWILGELRARYPNARIVRSNWDLARTDRFRVADNFVDGWQRHVVRMEALEVPFADPGVYRVWARFRTTGTRFTCPGRRCRNVRANGRRGTSTPPQVLTGSRNLRVWMLDSFLIE